MKGSRMSLPLIRFEHVDIGYHYRQQPVFSDLSFTMVAGDVLGIVGPNGSGKSTLLKALLGILPLRKGHIVFADSRRPRFGYVPQRGYLDEIYPLSVADIVMMGRYRSIGLFKRPAPLDRSKVEEALLHLGIYDLAAAPFSTLSGGQKQRALIARALASEPEVLVLDEPTEGLDLATAESLLTLIQHFQQDHHLTVILVSHQLDTIAAVCNTIGVIHKGQFRLAAKQDWLEERSLNDLFDMPVHIHSLHNRLVIFPGSHHD
jgi:ABC-type Mn2+/Zn2+ transport system ATPase subunit